MIPLDDAHALLNEWYENGRVGNLVFFFAPRRGCVDAIIEQTIKMRELGDEDRRSLEKAFKVLNATRAEFRGNKEDGLDLVKISRSVDG